MKKFLTFCSRKNLTDDPVLPYQAIDNPKLHYGEKGQDPKATYFPIIPCLHGYTEAGDTVEVLSVVEDREECKQNAIMLEKEVAELCKQRNVQLCGGKVTQIPVPNDEGIDSLLKTFGAIIERIEDNDVLHACLTYSSKTNMIIELMALRYARLIRKDCYIECVVYGDMDHRLKTKTIRDVTPLVQLDDLLRMVASAGVCSPEQTIRQILDL